jgi:hypothetical protein
MKPLPFLILLSMAFAQPQQTPFDEPVVQTVADAAQIVQSVQDAKEAIFVVAPTLRSEALVRVLGEQAERVPVYVVVQEPPGELSARLSQAGAQVRTLPNMVEGLILIDYAKLFAGGLASGTGGDTQYIDLEPYGNQSIVQQLRGLWQAATPLGAGEAE